MCVARATCFDSTSQFVASGMTLLQEDPAIISHRLSKRQGGDCMVGTPRPDGR
jgi:hypothetical protein